MQKISITVIHRPTNVTLQNSRFVAEEQTICFFELMLHVKSSNSVECVVRARTKSFLNVPGFSATHNIANTAQSL